MDTNFLSNGHANMVGTKENTTDRFRPQLVLVYDGDDIQPVTVPEPTSMFLLGSGIVGLVGLKRRSRRL